MKKFRIEQKGEMQIVAFRTLVVEAPDDVTTEELCDCLDADRICELSNSLDEMAPKDPTPEERVKWLGESIELEQREEAFKALSPPWDNGGNQVPGFLPEEISSKIEEINPDETGGLLVLRLVRDSQGRLVRDNQGNLIDADDEQQK